MNENINKTIGAIDETIEAICDWIQKEVTSGTTRPFAAEMTKALAELVTARAL
jgi:hypothetical protein